MAIFTNMKTDKERQLEAKRRAYQQRNLPNVSDDPRFEAAQKELILRLGDYRTRNPAINTSTARDMQELVNSFRETAKRQGVVMPKMRLVYFVRMSHVCVWPEDMEEIDLKRRVHIFVQHRVRHNRHVDVDDLVAGIKRAYPEYSPSRTTFFNQQSLKTNSQEITNENAS